MQPSGPNPLPIVADANMLMSLLIAEGSKRRLFFSKHLIPACPEFALFEIGKHWQEIVERSRLQEEKLKVVLSEVRGALRTVPLSDMKDFMHEASQVSPDPDDVEYFALALKLNCPIWSEDKLLKKQSKIKVLNTPELLAMLGLK